MKKIILSLAFLIIVHCTFKIELCEGQWVQMSNGMGANNCVYSFIVSGNNIFAASWIGVFRSTNNGSNWQTSLNNQYVNSLTTLGNNIFAGTGYIGVCLSTNNGTSWTQTGLNISCVPSLATLGNNIFAGTVDTGVYISTNNGTNWIQTALNNKQINSLAVYNSNIFAGTFNSGIYRSTDNGINWIHAGLNGQNVVSIATLGNNIFAGTDDSGLYLSTNNGTNWILTSLHGFVYSLAVIENYIFAGRLYGVVLSSNNGANWIDVSQGLVYQPLVSSLLITNDYIFAGTAGYSVWRRSLSEILTGIQNIGTEIPSRFSLSQNYPNPFNPVTKIKFDIPPTPTSTEALRLRRGNFVRVVVFDLLGREVTTLVNEQLAPGTYEVEWNASQFSSGIYFYQLKTGDFVATKKLILLK